MEAVLPSPFVAPTCWRKKSGPTEATKRRKSVKEKLRHARQREKYSSKKKIWEAVLVLPLKRAPVWNRECFTLKLRKGWDFS